MGPALTAAVNNLDFGDQVTLASDGYLSKGEKKVSFNFCCSRLANVGVGRMDGLDQADAKQVYIEAGESCRLRGVTVIISVSCFSSDFDVQF